MVPTRIQASLVLVVRLVGAVTNSYICSIPDAEIFPYGTRVCFLGSVEPGNPNSALPDGLYGIIEHRGSGWFSVVNDGDTICGRYMGTTIMSEEHTWEYPYSDDWSRIKNSRPRVICDKDGLGWLCRLRLDKEWLPAWLYVLFVVPILMLVLLLSLYINPDDRLTESVRSLFHDMTTVGQTSKVRGFRSS
jgi:hypothetical protein